MHRAGGGLAKAGLVVLVLVLATCSGSVDERRMARCRRAVPALAPSGSAITLLRVGSGPTSDSVRVDYRLDGRSGADTKARHVLCRFGPGTSLTSIVTEDGPISGASVYLLEHYYLDTPEAVDADIRP